MTQTAWSTPQILAAGYTVQGSDWNTSIYDNTLYLYDGPMAKYHSNTDLSIATATWTSRSFQIADWDTDGIGPALNSNGQFTIQTPGIYHWVGTYRFGSVTGGSTRSGRLNMNSGALLAQTDCTLTSASLTANGVVTVRQNHNVGDVVVLEVYQDSGSGLLNFGSNVPLGYSLSCKWEGPGS